MSLFYITEDLSGDHHELVVLVAGGELDFHASPRLRESIAEQIGAGCRRIVLDLSAVTFIDSTAIGVLIGAATRLQEAGGGSVAAVCSDDNERVLRIFDIAGVDSVITLYSSREQAVSATAPVA
jgi:anti-sigma B factor antagonist